MTREVELTNYSFDGKGSGGRAMPEANPGGGRRITLREIVNRHFTENADQVYSHLLFMNKLLQATGGKFTLSPEILLPLLTDRKSEVRDKKFTLFADFPYDNRPKFEKKFGDAILTELRDSCELVALEGKKRVFKIKPPDKSVPILSGQKEDTPLVIVEEKSEIDGARSIGLRFVNNPGEANKSYAISEEETILNFEIKQLLFLSHEGSLDWIDVGRADWVNNEEEPYVYLTDKALRILSQPMNIHNEIYGTAREFFRDYQYYLMKEVFANPNFELVNFPIYIPGRAEERYIRPYYYLDLVLLGAKMIELCALSNRDVPIANESREMFKEEMLEFQKPLFMIEFAPKKFDNRNLTYSPIEYLMYELLWRGVDIWPYMDEFTNSMVQSFKTDPERFWKTADALGFDQVLPIFHGMDETSRERLKSKLKTDSEPAILRRIFSLIPSLAPYYDRNPVKEKGYDQSDEYYMQITLALAAYSHDVGQEQVAAIAVHNGKVIGARRNDTNLREDEVDTDRHAEKLLIKSLGKALKPGTKVFVSLVPCEICTHSIRRNHNIVEVNCSLGSHSGDIESLTNPHLRENKRDERITEEPPLVKLGILEDVARNFYIKTQWTQMPIYYGKGIQVFDNRGKRHLRTMIIFGGDPHHDDLIRKMRAEE